MNLQKCLAMIQFMSFCKELIDATQTQKKELCWKLLRFSSNGYKTYIAKKVWGKGKKSLVLPSKHHIRVCLTAKIDEKTSFYKLFLI